MRHLFHPLRGLLLLAICSLLNGQLRAQSTTVNDDQAINECIQQFYRYLNFNNGNTASMDSLPRVCTSNASIIANFTGKPMQWTVISFIAFMKESVSKQSIIARQETELFERTDVFGNIAQRFSTYSIQFTTKDKVEQRRGINAIQLLKVEGQWLISAIIWDTEKPGNPIPSMYIRK